MVRRIEDLRRPSDDELIRKHDAPAQHTSVGTDYYVQELNRRSRDRSTDATIPLARRTYVLSVVSAALAAIAVVVSVVALFLR